MRRLQVFPAKTQTENSAVKNPRCAPRATLICCFVALSALVIPQVLMAQNTAITTFHYNNGRTGWNQNETILTPANVASSSFGILQTIPLDAQIDTQPLIVPNQMITAGDHQGIHNVVYLASENNTIYAIDYDTGDVLLSPNFGAPVSLPFGCVTNPVVGVNSTPVLNLATNTMFVMIYTLENGLPIYRLHALGLGSLTDQGPPVVVSASQSLDDGTIFNFDATYERQRAALLLANGNVYAGFGSFCDKGFMKSRGWLLGWKADTLAPLPSNQLLNTQAKSLDSFFLTAIWMSGWGVAADPAGSLYFITGNSDPSGNTYDGLTNLQESVIKVSPDLSEVTDLFTPLNWSLLDKGDKDFGAGGVMLLPPVPGLNPLPNMAVAAGKDGNMYLMNQADLGGYDPTQNHVLGTFPIGNCFCGASYYIDPVDRIPRIVSSGGATVKIWKVQTHPTITLLNVANSGALFQRAHGFFTSISSNGLSNPIVWAISRQTFQTSQLSFFAFDLTGAAGNLNPIFSALSFGNWSGFGNANVVPVVANGKVFVTNGPQLTIMGLKNPLVKKAAKAN